MARFFLLMLVVMPHFLREVGASDLDASFRQDKSFTAYHQRHCQEYIDLKAQNDVEGALASARKWFQECNEANDGYRYYHAALFLSRQQPMLLMPQEIVVAFFNAAYILKSRPSDTYEFQLIYRDVVRRVAYNWRTLFRSGLQALEAIYDLYPPQLLDLPLSPELSRHIETVTAQAAMNYANLETFEEYVSQNKWRMMSHHQLTYFGPQSAPLVAAIRYYMCGDRDPIILDYLKFGWQEMTPTKFLLECQNLGSDGRYNIANMLRDIHVAAKNGTDSPCDNYLKPLSYRLYSSAMFKGHREALQVVDVLNRAWAHGVGKRMIELNQMEVIDHNILRPCLLWYGMARFVQDYCILAMCNKPLSIRIRKSLYRVIKVQSDFMLREVDGQYEAMREGLGDRLADFVLKNSHSAQRSNLDILRPKYEVGR